MMLPVAILAGGLATRLWPITTTIPKALISIGNWPFVEWQLSYLRSQGITRVVICSGYLSSQIQAAVGDGSKFNLDLFYSEDGPNLLGTGGALKKALPLLGDSFFVLYGDSFLPVEFLPIQTAFENSNKLNNYESEALMTILRNENRWDRSNVLFKNGVLVEYNKTSPTPDMEFIDYGLGILRAKALQAHQSRGPFDLAEVYRNLSLKKKLVGYEVYNRFYEIGSFSGISETESYLLKSPFHPD